MGNCEPIIIQVATIVVTLTDAEWEREEMYHLLVADKERGIDRFKSLCNKAIDSYRLSTLDLLFSYSQ